MHGSRVLHLTEHWRAGGTEAVVASLVGGLANRGHDVTLATLDRRPSGDPPPDVPFHRLPSRRFSVVAPFLVAALLRRGKFDVLHTHQAGADLAGSVAARLMRIPTTISTRHDMLPFRARAGAKGALFRMLDRHAVRRSSRTVCVSEAVKEFFVRREGMDPRSLTVISNGVDTGLLHPLSPEERLRGRDAFRLPAGAFVAGFLGRLEEAKGADHLPAIWREVRRALPDAILAVAGEGGLQRTLKGAPGIVPLGRIEDPSKFLPLLDLLLVPSRSEGFSLAVVEAASCGAPAVAFAAGGLVETIADGESGFLVPQGDDAAMAERVVLLARDAALLRRLGAAARERAVRRFGLDRMIDAYDRLYREVAAGGIPA